MATWLTPTMQNMPADLAHAYNAARRRTTLNRYRSRTDVTEDLITTAFSWMRLPKIFGETLEEPSTSYFKYSTRAIQRGIDAEQAKANAVESLNVFRNNPYYTQIVTFNTSTAAAASNAVKEMLDADPEYTELNVRTMLTSTPNHKIHVYRYCDTDNRTMYVVLNNVDTPSVIFKLATAIMLDKDYFGNQETTEKFAEVWMTGNADAIFDIVAQYYKEYNENKQERELNAAINAMITNLTDAKKAQFEMDITQYQREIDQHYTDISILAQKLDEIKAKYLLQVTTNEDQKIVDLQQYFASCKDKISYMNAANNEITVIYKTPLIYFEESLLKPYFESARNNTVNTAPEWVQQLLKDIFIEKTYELQIESGITMNLKEKRFQYARVNSYIAVANLQGIPNPHHRYYNCWGDNQPRIHRALQEGNYLTAFLTAFAAMAGLNLSDTAVMDRFVKDELYEYESIPCLKNKETGEMITAQEYERRYRNASDQTN